MTFEPAGATGSKKAAITKESLPDGRPTTGAEANGAAKVDPAEVEKSLGLTSRHSHGKPLAMISVELRRLLG